MPRPLIGVVFYGIPRSGEYTFKSIQANILEPAMAMGRVCVRYHFYRQKEIDNPRSGERGPIPLSDYKPYEAFEGILESPGAVDNAFDLKKIYSHGDPWKDGFKSMRNFLMQLHSLSSATRQVMDESPDIVIFARPDLLYHHSMRSVLEKALRQSQFSIARIPSWQWSWGYNDRFAICSSQATQWYGLRENLVEEYLSVVGGPLHSEGLLKYCLDRSLCSVKPFNATASRVRINGTMVREGFKPVRGAKLLRFKAKEACKYLVKFL